MTVVTQPGAILVVGYGNPLRSDDGVGPTVAATLLDDPRLAGADIRAEHQLTPELALDASTASLVVLVDADDALAPGEIAVRRVGEAGPDAGGAPPMTHHLDPEALAGLARTLWGTCGPIVVVGVGTATTEVGEGLSPEVAAAVARAADVIAGIAGGGAGA